VTIAPALAERLSAELQRLGERHREARKRLHDVFELGPLPDKPLVELADLSPEELARFTVDVLWPPTQEECVVRARELMARAYDEVVGQKQNPEGA
jgi:hypothetical protein